MKTKKGERLMSTATHTPGPWYILERPYRGEAYSVVVDTSTTRAPVKTQLAIAGIHDTNRGDDETKANARLIAAAPTLLAALCECFEALIQAQPYVGEAGAGAKLLDMLEHADEAARTALAAAEGRDS